MTNKSGFKECKTSEVFLTALDKDWEMPVGESSSERILNLELILNPSF